jgi:hypothetical protein
VNGDISKEFRRGLMKLTIATVILYLGLIAVGVYVYTFGRQAQQIEDNTDRLNAAIGAFCEVGAAPDSREGQVLHEIALGTLVITTHDCQVIVRKVKQGENTP